MKENDINTVVSKNLRACMSGRGLSQKELAEALGVSQASISNWCQGIKMPRMDKIDRICDLFGIKRSYLLCEHTIQNDLTPCSEAMRALISERPDLEELLSIAGNAGPEAVRQAVRILKALQS